MANIIVHGNGLFFKALVKYLHDSCGVRVCYWISCEEEIDSVKADFNESLVVVLQRLNIGNVRDHVDPVSLPPVDEAILAALNWCEPILFEMMDRMDPSKQFRYDDRVRLYHFYIRYWLKIINTLRPEVYLSIYANHEVADFVLFALCKHYGIRTPMFEWTSLSKRRLLIEDYRGIPENLKNTYAALKAQREEPVISEESKKNIALVRGEYTKAMPGYFVLTKKEAGEKVAKKNSWAMLKRLISIPYRIFRILHKISLYRQRVPSVLDGLYFTGPLPNVVDSHLLTRLELRLVGERIRSSFLAAQGVYKGLCVEMDFTVPYVYLALHYQPERTTCPAGGVFSDQRLVISLLSKSLPKGWVLYVKEHPSQFLTANGRYGYLSRSSTFYMDIAAHENVRLIRQEVPQFELIDCSKAVATITGTSGWEALVRGKPVLVFGDGWYQACDGAYRVRTHDDCKNALASIADGSCMSNVDINRFVAAIEAVAVRVYLGEEEASWDGAKFDEQSNVKVAGTAICNFLHLKALEPN